MDAPAVMPAIMATALSALLTRNFAGAAGAAGAALAAELLDAERTRGNAAQVTTAITMTYARRSAGCSVRAARLLSTSAPRSHSSTSTGSTTNSHGSADEAQRIDAMLRVDHAGEIGANYIYMGQAAVLKRRDPATGALIEHMWEQEKTHLRVLDDILAHNRVRPSALRPLWEAAGFALGAGTALLGKEAAMACTEAVEAVIGEHYNDQIRELVALDKDPQVTKLAEVLRQFRDDELEHLDTAVDHDAKKAPAYAALTGAITVGCKTAIWIAQRV
ncbi:ubiquinone biosynthesis protein COQ7-domain-containing protein [Entophlyctis helioformis]|nr:ubiquinone biosynthesis protein COQ7-domain-containing protein [Entophlyctis helioformis]